MENRLVGFPFARRASTQSETALSSSSVTSSESQEQSPMDVDLPAHSHLPTKELWPDRECERIQATVACTDGYYWHARSIQQELYINKLEADQKKKDDMIARLTAANSTLEARLADALATGKQLLARFKSIQFGSEQLREQLHSAQRSIMRLKRSDRAKGKVQQRNLRLKAHMNSHICGAKEETAKEETLLEALALANQRMEELEGAGEKLLDALGREGDTEENHRNDNEEDEAQGGAHRALLEAEAAFRDVIEDDTYEEHKAHWVDLLDD